MHGCLVLVNAGVDSMGGVIDGGVEVSSAPSPHQSSDLEKTQAELRETFTTAENFRRELEFLQKGGDPLDLKVGTAASVSLQSTSLTDQHPEQFVTSEVKGSFAATASPHGDSVESSGRLGGALSVGEPNSADNLMLFDGNNNKSVSGGIELPEKSYKRRIRSRPNRHGSRDTKGLADNHDHKNLSNSNSNSTPKSPNNVGLDLKNLGSSNTHLDIKSNGTQETPLSMSSEKETLSGVDAHTVDDSKSPCRQTDQSLDGDNKNQVSTSVRNVDCNGSMELDIASKEAANMEGNDVNTVKDDINNNEIGPTLKEEEGLKGSESALLHDLKKSVCCTGSDLDGCTTSDTDKKPLGTESTTLPPSCSINLKLATKEHEDSILEEARIIEEKRKRIAGLSALIPKSESNHRSHWSFVLEEMSWLANDFAQERLWKVTASAQISKKAAYSSRVRFQQQKPLWEQKAVAHTLSESVMEFWNTVQVKCKEMELEESKKDSMTGLDEYGKRFLEYNNSSKCQYNLAQAPVTPDRISDLGITHISWEDNLTEESLFYMVPPGAIEAYRKSIESYLLQSERTGSSMQEDVDGIGYDDVADNTLEEEEGETSTYYLPGAFEGSRMLSKPTQKKRKHGQQFKSYIPRSYDTGADMSFPQSLERNMGKRPGTSVINVSIPTKRVRTASRPRFIINNNSNSQAPNRADASSGDTNSFQDEQSGYQIPQNNNMEAESVGDYEKQLHFDMTEVSNRPKKKKKGPTLFDHRWQHDSGFQNDQKEHSKRRLDTRQFDSNGNSVGSQMSNMSNPNKFMKLLVRDRGRKAKSLKTPIGHQGSGSPWSLFEDQALVVLVHDMGANWELISDAINSTLQFKCISRNSKECKERHKILMDRSSGDGADSAEDSGSSQPYPSTLPGIPEGSARQLFQRLQGPMEEDTLKSHFEKIIVLSRKLHFKKSQKDNQDPKQLQQPHGSHALALSQVCPNNLNGGPVLTPLDLCEPITPTPDFLPVGYQVPHTSSAPSSSVFGKPNPNPHPNPNPNSPSVNVREGRYGIPRMEDQQHRMQQYNQMMSARNMQQQQPTASSGPHSVRMLPGGNGNNGMGVMSAMNRGMMMMPRPPLSSNSVRSRDPPHMIRNQEGGSGTSPRAGTGKGNFTQPPAVQPYPMSPHMPPHHLPTTTNPQHPAFGMQMLKERQRLRQQQFAAAASNPAMPRGQPVPSSPQQSQSPIGTNPPVTQHLQKPGPVGGVVRSPQGVQRRPPQQFQPPPGGRQQLAAVSKGGGASGVTNGFVAEHHLVQSSGGGGGGNLYSGPSGLNPTSPLIQKRFPGQSQPQQKSKLMNPSQMTPAQKIILQNRKAAGNSSELLLPTATNTTSTSAKTKLQARGLILTKPPSSDDVAAADRKKSEAEAAKQSSSDNSLKPSNNSNSDSGVQWQKQQPSS